MIDSFVTSLWGSTLMIVGFLVMLTIIVFVHEMGHFLVARWCGVTVRTFSIGFGPELWGFFDRKGTRWRVAAIPLGGYVKFVDDANPASAPDLAAGAELTPEERKGAFQFKPLWQRAAVVAAGPVANFILTLVIFTAVVLAFGLRKTSPVIDAVQPGEPAAVAGLLPGDEVLAVDGADVMSFDEFDTRVKMSEGRPIEIVVRRGEERRTFNVKPATHEVENDLGIKVMIADIGVRQLLPARIADIVPGFPAEQAGLKVGDVIRKVGDREVAYFHEAAEIINASPGQPLLFTIERGQETFTLEVVPKATRQKTPGGAKVTGGRIGVSAVAPRFLGPVDALRLGWRRTEETALYTVLGLAGFFGNLVSGGKSDQVGGAIMMAEMTAHALDYGFEEFLSWIAIASMSIGLLNLMPIPVLDGGHLLFYAIEALRRRPLSARTQEIGFRIGLAMVLSLVVYANLSDILRVGRRWLFGGG